MSSKPPKEPERVSTVDSSTTGWVLVSQRTSNYASFYDSISHNEMGVQGRGVAAVLGVVGLTNTLCVLDCDL